MVNGQKVWTTLAHVADYGILLTRTDPDRPKHAGLTMFVVDMHAPGVTVRPLRQMGGQADFNEVFFDDVRIPDSERLGEPGEGWRVALTTLMNERVAIGGAGGDIGLPVEALVAARPGPAARASTPSGRCWRGRRSAGRSSRRSAARYTGYRRLTVLSQGGMPGPGGQRRQARRHRGGAAGRRRRRPAARRRRGLRRDRRRRRPLAAHPGVAARASPSPAAPTRCCATSSASGCSGLPPEPRNDKTAPFSGGRTR